jgi:hypothetical protein
VLDSESELLCQYPTSSQATRSSYRLGRIHAKDINREIALQATVHGAGVGKRDILRAQRESHGMLLRRFDPVLRIWSEGSASAGTIAHVNFSRHHV